MKGGLEEITFKIEGTVGTLMHNGQMADPLNEYAKKLATYTSKRKKTDEDRETMALIEWRGGLYVGEDGKPCWPAVCIDGMLIEAAKKSRRGKDAKAAVFCKEEGLQFDYDGPKEIELLIKSPEHRMTVKAGVQSASVMRTRPYFKDWTMQFTLEYLPSVVDRDTIIEWVNTAGLLVGLSDWRPRYGRFNVIEIDGKKVK